MHFLQKWLDFLLLMTSYLVTIAADSHQICVKICLRDMCTATETAGLDNNSSCKNCRKPYGEWHPPRSLYARGLRNPTIPKCAERMHSNKRRHRPSKENNLDKRVLHFHLESCDSFITGFGFSSRLFLPWSFQFLVVLYIATNVL